MIVGVCEITLRLPASRSLKAKRKILRQLLDRCRARFPVSIAEVADNDLHGLARVGVAMVANDRRHIESTLDRLLELVHTLPEALVTHVEREIMVWDEAFEGDGPWDGADLSEPPPWPSLADRDRPEDDEPDF